MDFFRKFSISRRRGYVAIMGICAALGLAICIPETAVAGNTNYQYDALGRIVKVTFPDTKQICYAYDAAGNRTQVKRQATGSCTVAVGLLASQTSASSTEGGARSASEESAIQTEQNEPETIITASDEQTVSY